MLLVTTVSATGCRRVIGMMPVTGLAHSLSPTFLFPAICLAADSSDTQFTWIRLLANSGVEILPSADEEEERVRTAQSIFDFEAADIFGSMVSLRQYR